MRSVVGLFCIVEWRYLSISDANIQNLGTRLQVFACFLTFRHSTKACESYMKSTRINI